MLRLNNDCLCELFSYFTLKEQLTLTKVCKRWQRCIICDIWRLRYRKLGTTGEQPQLSALSNEEYQEFFHQMARYIKHFTLADSRHIPFTSYLGRVTKRPDLSYYLSYRYDNLEVLYCFDPSIHDGHIIQFAKNCPALRELHIHSKYVTGAYLEKMHNLRKLNASECSLKAANFKVMNNSYLIYLDISNTMLDTSALSQVIASKEQPLKTLCLDVNQLEATFMTNLHKYPNLLAYRINETEIMPLLEEDSKNWFCFFELQAKRIEMIKFCNPHLENEQHKTLTNLMVNKYLKLLRHVEIIHFERSCSNEKYASALEYVKGSSVLTKLLSYLESESSSNLQEIRLSNYDIWHEAFHSWLNSLDKCKRHAATTKKIVLNIFIDKQNYEQDITNSSFYYKPSNYIIQLNSFNQSQQDYNTSVELHLKNLQAT